MFRTVKKIKQTSQAANSRKFIFPRSLPGARGAGGDHGEAPGGVQHGGAHGEGRGEDSLPGGGAAGV